MLGSPVTSSIQPSGAAPVPGAPSRRHTLSSALAAPFSDTFDWSPPGFQPGLVASPISDHPSDSSKPPEHVQRVSHESQPHDSNAQLWKATLERAVKGIVSIKYTLVRSFDVHVAGTYTGTGFVVDSSNGIILSNRHIITPGPIMATALFNKSEEVSLLPLYIDPVHDFGFLKYNPATIKYAEIEQIELCPEAAKVGTEIKICGNDAGEHGSIWGSTLARLDRPPPYHTDFNTFYIQAVSGTSAGSSGSPVLDIHGRAVALNVGGSANSATSFYLPLDRVVRALKLLQRGKPIPRGTLQTEFIHVSYDKLKRLGLPDEIEIETRKRNEDSTGLLTVRLVLPEGPGSGVLEVGDVVVKCHHPAFGDRYIENFVSLWEMIDETIGDTIVLTVLRGKETKELEVKARDLATIIPDRFVEIGQAIIHPVSYQISRLFHMPCRGLIMVDSGLTNIPAYSIITQIEDRNVNSLDDLIQITQSIPDGKRINIRYRRVGTSGGMFAIFAMDHHFFPMVLFRRKNGIWERDALKSNLSRESELGALDIRTAATWRARLRSRLLDVRCRTPYPVQGIPSATTGGVGLLVAETPIPLIVVSRSIVPVSVCDIWITIGNRSVPGRVAYLGIVAVLTLNGTQLGSNDVLPISTNEYKVGDRLELFAIDSSQQLIQLPAEVREIAPISIGHFQPPRWHSTNVEVLFMLGPTANNDGVLLDPEDKSVVAMWMTLDGIKIGLDYNRYIRPVVEMLQKPGEISNRCCGWAFALLSIPDAMHLGLTDQHANRITALAGHIRSVPRALYVWKKLRPMTQGNLRISDIVLEINGLPVARMADMHILTRLESAQLLVLRDRQEISVNLQTECIPSEVMGRVLFWAGAFLHETHDAVLEQITPEFEEIARREGISNIWQSVYVGSVKAGSPAAAGLVQSHWILEVEGNKVKSMDDMLDLIPNLRDQREYLRVKIIAVNGVMSVLSMRPDSRFWPPWILEWKDEQWVRTELE